MSVYVCWFCKVLLVNDKGSYTIRNGLQQRSTAGWTPGNKLTLGGTLVVSRG